MHSERVSSRNCSIEHYQRPEEEPPLETWRIPMLVENCFPTMGQKSPINLVACVPISTHINPGIFSVLYIYNILSYIILYIHMFDGSNPDKSHQPGYNFHSSHKIRVLFKHPAAQRTPHLGEALSRGPIQQPPAATNPSAAWPGSTVKAIWWNWQIERWRKQFCRFKWWI